MRSRTVGIVVVLTILAGGVVFASGGAEVEGGVDQVSIRTNWLWYGSHGIFFLGRELGYYEEENIDLDIREGNGSANGVRLVANKDDTFAYASSATMINLAAQGAPVVSVAVVDAEGVDAVFCDPDSGVRTLQDLEGHTVLTTASAGTNLFFPVAVENAGADISKIELMNVAEGAKITSYLQGLAPCTLGGLDDVPAEVEANGGQAPVAMPYSDYGVYQPGYSIVAHRDLVEDDPDLVERFVRATLRSVEAAQVDPEAAVMAMVNSEAIAADEAVLKQMLQVLDVTLSILISDNNTGEQIGMHVPEDWQSALSLLKEYTELETEIPAGDFYTNEFLPY